MRLNPVRVNNEPPTLQCGGSYVMLVRVQRASERTMAAYALCLRHVPSFDEEGRHR
jgi:hypothetical protein